ncbi:DHA2 family efflux MFS transporter permease subunit [Streptomyces sp. NPDC005970]|uniref:DHA2 family efflux MFS transporter permease subunit n=1 Tax=Streptomyces sp. NPDC005970 TaxID=3156723 RepID=UPI00340991F8
MTNTEAPKPASRRTSPTHSARAALTALCLGLFMIVVDTSIVAVAVPAMVRDLHAGLNAVVWVTSVYLLTYAVPMLFTSRLADRHGPKRLFVAGLALFSVACLGAATAPNIQVLIAARAIEGLGAALLTPQTLTLITHLFPDGERGRAMGMLGATSGLATVAGPLLGGLLVDRLGWEWIFYLNVLLGTGTLVMSLRVLPDWRPGHARRIDPLGILLSAAGLTLIVFGVQNGRSYDWGALVGPVTVPQVIVAGVVLLGAFVLSQRFTRDDPLLPLRLFRDRNFSVSALITAALGFSMTGMFLPLVLHLQTTLGLTPTQAGLLTAPMALIAATMGPFIGRLSDRVNAKYLVLSGLLGMALGLALVAVRTLRDAPAWQCVPGLLLCGLGMGLALVPLNNTALRTVPPELRGTASGTYFTARQLGAVLGSATTSAALQARSAQAAYLPLILVLLLAGAAAAILRGIGDPQRMPDAT